MSSNKQNKMNLNHWFESYDEGVDHTTLLLIFRRLPTFLSPCLQSHQHALAHGKSHREPNAKTHQHPSLYIIWGGLETSTHSHDRPSSNKSLFPLSLSLSPFLSAWIYHPQAIAEGYPIWSHVMGDMEPNRLFSQDTGPANNHVDDNNNIDTGEDISDRGWI